MACEESIIDKEDCQHGTGKGSFFNFIIVLLSISVTVVPLLSVYVDKRIYCLILILWYVDVFFHTRKFFCRKFVIVPILWLIYVSLLAYVGYSSASIGNYYILMLVFDLINKSFFVGEYYSRRQKQILLRIIQIIFLFAVIQNIFIGFTNPGFLEYHYSDIDEYFESGAFTTLHYEMLAFYVIFSLYLFLREHHRIFKIIEIISIVCSLYFMFSFAPRTNSAIIIVFFAYTLFVNKGEVSLIKIISSFVIVSVVMICLFIFQTEISSFLPERMSPRFDATMNLLSGASISDTAYTGRFVLFVDSLKTFLSSPINFLFGIGWHLGREYYHLTGQHSLLTSYAAYFGCMGIIFLTYYFSLIGKHVLRYSGGNYVYCKSMLLTLVFCAVITYPMYTPTIMASVFVIKLLQ